MAMSSPASALIHEPRLMSAAIRLGRFSGAEVVADASAFLLAGLFGGAVYVHLQRSVPTLSDEVASVIAVVCGIAVLACVFLHEASHAIVAKRRGLTLRSIRLSLYGGYSVIEGTPSARSEFLVSAAGPVASLALGIVFLAGPLLLGGDTPIGAAMWALGVANVAIGALNLLPGFPLDGGRIVRSVLARGGRDRVRATRAATTLGRAIGVAAILVGVFLVVTQEMIGLFWIAAGWALASTAVSAGRREEMSVAFAGMTALDVMRPTPDAVSGDSTISNALDLFEVTSRLGALPVEMLGRVVGVIGRDEVDSISPSRWPSMRVSAVMTRIGPGDVVEADAPLDSLVLRLSGVDGRVVVVQEGIVVGIIESSDLRATLGR